MKKIYISGKISGLDVETYLDNFNSAEEYLNLVYYKVIIVNPVKICSHLNPVLHTWEDYMLVCVENLFKCQAIYMLDNWKESRGARIEYAIAKELGIDFIYE